MSRNSHSAQWIQRLAFTACLLFSATAFAQECSQASEIEPAVRTAIDNAATQFIQYAAHGDVQSLRQASIPALATAFGGVQAAITRDKGLIGDQVTIRREYLPRCLEGHRAPTPCRVLLRRLWIEWTHAFQRQLCHSEPCPGPLCPGADQCDRRQDSLHGHRGSAESAEPMETGGLLSQADGGLRPRCGLVCAAGAHASSSRASCTMPGFTMFSPGKCILPWTS